MLSPEVGVGELGRHQNGRRRGQSLRKTLSLTILLPIPFPPLRTAAAAARAQPVTAEALARVQAEAEAKEAAAARAAAEAKEAAEAAAASTRNPLSSEAREASGLNEVIRSLPGYLQAAVTRHLDAGRRATSGPAVEALAREDDRPASFSGAAAW